MQVVRDFEPADRYVYDFGVCSAKKGFAQVDTGQDAWYFGTWASPSRRMIVSYTEGDVTIQTADDDAEFAEAMRGLKAWHEEHGWRFLGIDPGFNVELAESFRAVGLGDLLH